MSVDNPETGLEAILLKHNHQFRKFVFTSHEDKQLLTAACMNCGMKIIITSSVNKISITGNAATSSCPYAKTNK